MVTNGSADLLDLCNREGGGNMEGGVDVALKVSKGIGSSKTSRTAVESLSLHL